MNVRFIFGVCVLTLMLGSCRQHLGSDELPESREAKQLLQGEWSDEDTETLVFQLRGDSVYYPDSTSMPAYFRVYQDTLFIGSQARYFIEKHTEHLLWFRIANGELVKLVRNTNDDSKEIFRRSRAQVLTLTEVLKKDTVVNYDGKRYHLYVAVNPTKYKVVRHIVNDEGLDVENIYYDNIIHLSVFQGAQELFSRDFRKQQYQQHVPQRFYEQAVLNNMEFSLVDDKGFHMDVSICTPGDAICYMVDHIVTFEGQLITPSPKGN